MFKEIKRQGKVKTLYYSEGEVYSHDGNDDIIKVTSSMQSCDYDVIEVTRSWQSYDAIFPK